MRPPILGLFLPVAVFVGCSNPGLAYAPRHPGPERAAKDVSSMKVLEIGVPDCDYDVIGTAFGTSLDVLREVAATHGGDGVYDTSCVVQLVNHYYFQQAHGQCDGRVFVCRGPKKRVGG